jgi:membrane associated rhomboid family serine protease
MKLDNWVAYRILVLLLLLGIVSVLFLWTLSPTGSRSQTTFATGLSGVLVIFAMISYIFRVSKWDEGVSRGPLIAGCVALMIIFYVGLAA